MMRIYPVFLANQGCPHRCLFCDQSRTAVTTALPSPERLAKVLDHLLPAQGDGEIAFYGGTFTQLPDEVQRAFLAIARQHVRAGRVTGIRLSTRPDALDGTRLAFLAAAGVATIEIGCQSFDDSVLASSGRGHTAVDSQVAIRRCRSAGFRVGVQLMPGLPGAAPDEAMSSLESALKEQPEFVRIYPTVVVAGTALETLWRSGGYHPWSLELAVEICADLLLTCRSRGVPVIRLGLQQDPTLSANLLAGPHHPAFGQLVRSRLWRRAYLAIPDKSVRIEVNPRDLSDALGHGGQNRRWLADEGSHHEVRPDPGVPIGRLRSCGQIWPVDDLARQVTQHAC